MNDLLTPTQIDAINHVRRILSSLEKQAMNKAASATVKDVFQGYDCGRIAAVAEFAGDMLFQVLNHTNTYGNVGMTEAQLHDDARRSPDGN